MAGWFVRSARRPLHNLRCLSHMLYADKVPLQLYDSLRAVISSPSSPQSFAQGNRLSLLNTFRSFISSAPRAPPTADFWAAKKVHKNLAVSFRSISCQSMAVSSRISQLRPSQARCSYPLTILSLTAFALYTSQGTDSLWPPTSVSNRGKANHFTCYLLILPLRWRFTRLNMRSGPRHTFAASSSSPLPVRHRCSVPSLTWTFRSILRTHRHFVTLKITLPPIVHSWSQLHVSRDPLFNQKPSKLLHTFTLHPQLSRHATNRNILIGIQQTHPTKYFSSLSVSRNWLPIFLPWTLHSFLRTHWLFATLSNSLPPIVNLRSQPHLPICLLFKQKPYELLHRFTVCPQLSRPPTYCDIWIGLILHWLLTSSTLYLFLQC